ncbi:MAG: multiheme c-type cytochrome, partial [Candidatus Binatia bacterium]
MTNQPRKRYVPAVGPRLKQLLLAVFGLFALLSMNSVYLSSITAFEWATGLTYQNYFYQYMFLLHLVLGAAIILPVLVFGVVHFRNARTRPNRRAVRVGYALFATSLVLLATGIVLTRLEFFEVRDPNVRSVAYWLHVATPIAVAWLFVLHRLAGPTIRWRVGAAWAAVAIGFACVMAALHAQDPRAWNVVGPESGEKYFFPSLARTATGGFIPAKALTNDDYCKQCHADVHDKWAHSVHRFSSFNNPVYLFSVRETRKVSLERDGNVQASRFCAGCHDPVPFFSGAFDDPAFDDVNHPTAKSGITCTSCHSIAAVNSNRGNADFTIEEPAHYPFAYSDNSALQWVNRQLVKSKPEFHKKTFLKPFHRKAEFCGTCHKVHLPVELNKYKWLRGQNHFDSYLLSGVSGHGVQSFYYPPKSVPNCNQCHMPLFPSRDFGAKFYDDSRQLKVHDHQFPSANTAIPHLVGMPAWVNEAHRKFLDGAVRIDFFGIREGGTIDGKLIAPLRPEVPALEPGKSYLLETVIRTVKMGHEFTQGTSDSNEVWLDVTAATGGRVVGRSGGRNDDGAVDPWSHFVNAYVLDREGKRIDRRNPQDIFVPLYNHQIPPGAADTLHYRLEVPRGLD